jgi:hypothetical protein
MKKYVMILALLVASAASADTLLIEGLSAEAASASGRPTRGMSMANVEARFGAPNARVAAIGEPPISRWEYPDFVVYFEYDHVVHAVVRR